MLGLQYGIRAHILAALAGCAMCTLIGCSINLAIGVPQPDSAPQAQPPGESTASQATPQQPPADRSTQPRATSQTQLAAATGHPQTLTKIQAPPTLAVPPPAPDSNTSDEPDNDFGGEFDAPQPDPPLAGSGTGSSELTVESPAGNPTNEYPVDLPTVLRLAGANNWSIQLATERIHEVQAQLDAAEALWLPNLNAGIGYTKHDGQIQTTPGPVIDTSRNSLFVGGGAKVSQFPLAGGSGGPARMFVDLSLADAIFEPLAARQMVSARFSNQTVTFNDTLMEAALAYLDLIEAQAALGLARQAYTDAKQIEALTDAFVRAGKGARADLDRAQVELKQREQEQVRRTLEIQVSSANLARLLQLQPGTDLRSIDRSPMPLQLVDISGDLYALIGQAQAMRPEVREHKHLLENARLRCRTEEMRPYIPNLFVGASGGVFGGGLNGEVPQLDGRADVDVMAVWEVRNLGLGTEALRAERSSQFRQASLELRRVYDQVAMEVTQAYHQINAARKRIEIAETQMLQAQSAYDSGIARIKGLEGLPLEAQQSLRVLTTARDELLSSVVDYNRGQVRLLRALGQAVSE